MINKKDKHTFTLSKVFDAPIQLMFDVHSQAEHIIKYWGPKGFTTTLIQFDFKPGGILHYCMESPEGHKSYGKQVYREIEEPTLINMITSFCDEKGNIIRHPMSDTWPKEVLNSMEFEAIDDTTTKLTVWGIPINATEAEMNTFYAAHENMRNGYGGTLAVLEEYLKSITK